MDAERDVERQGGKVEATTWQAMAATERILSGLHGQQAENLRIMASQNGNTEQLARIQGEVMRKVEQHEKQLRAMSAPH